MPSLLRVLMRNAFSYRCLSCTKPIYQLRCGKHLVRLTPHTKGLCWLNLLLTFTESALAAQEKSEGLDACLQSRQHSLEVG